jgi:hypothetical protein
MNAATEEILNRFDQSWTATQLFFNDLIDNNPELENLIPLCLFIQKFKKAGGNRSFRLGTSKQDLVISRSLEFGLRPDQKFITVQAKGNSFIISFRDGYKLHKEYRIKDLDDELLKGLLQTLKLLPVD